MPTFADFLTPAGAIVAAGVVTTLVEVIRRAIPLVVRVNGATLAFALTGGLYLLVGINAGTSTLDGALGVFLAWLSCATSAVGIKSTTRQLRK